MKRILLIILICLMLPLSGSAITYGLTGENTNFTGDVNVPSGSSYYVNAVEMVRLNKFDATEAPGVTNDIDEGYKVGSNWYDVTNDKAYICLDNTDGAAVWTETTGAGGGATQLSDLTDVNTSTPTDKYVLVADGVDFESRQLTSDDLSDVASIAMLDENETVTGWWFFTGGVTSKLIDDVYPPEFQFTRGRDGDPTYIVQENDTFGRIVFDGCYEENSTFNQTGAIIRAKVDGTAGHNDMPGRLEFLTSPDGTYAPALRLAIDNAGNIKMGDGAWTNYVNVTSGGVLTAEGSATVTATDLVPKQEIDFGAHSAGFTLQSTTGDGTTTIDWKLGNKFRFTFGAQNDTFTFTAPTNPCTLMLTLIQDATGSRTITWPATVKWPGGTAPTLTTTANARDKVALDWDGTQYDGVCSKDFK